MQLKPIVQDIFALAAIVVLVIVATVVFVALGVKP
jgi:hypothetical protein